MEELNFFANDYTVEDLINRLHSYSEMCDQILKEDIKIQRKKLTALRQSLEKDYKHTSLLGVEKLFKGDKFFRTFSRGIHEASAEVTGQVKNQFIGVSAAGIKSEIDWTISKMESLLEE